MPAHFENTVSVRELIERMRVEDRGFNVYGSGWHGYRFGPVLTPADVGAFEAQHRVTLPEDYRFFLTAIGNGGAWPVYRNIIGRNPGAGPGCGMFPLDEAIRGSDVSQPFPLRESTAIMLNEGTDEWDDIVPFPGALEICYRGGGSFSLLIINGPEFGMVWDAEFDACPTEYIPTRLSFAQWYQMWLTRLEDVALPAIFRERIADKVSVGMSVAQVIEICGGEWKSEPHRYSSSGQSGLSFSQLKTSFVIDNQGNVERIIPWFVSISGDLRR